MMITRRLKGWMVLAAVVGAAVPITVWAQTPETNPAPGEDVMRPTEHGLRLTPRLARTVASLMVEGMSKENRIQLTSEQQQELAEATARRMMTLAHRDGREVQAGLEYLLETGLSAMNGRGVQVKDYREFADKLQPLARSGRDLLTGFATDLRPMLSAEELEEFERNLAKGSRWLDRLEQRLEDCRAGRVTDGQDPFAGLDRDEDKENEAGAEDELLPPPAPKVDERVQRARNESRWEVEWAPTWSWNAFLVGAELVFKFDAEQKAKGQELLEQYRKKAEAIQTPAWKARVEQNRVQVHLKTQLGALPTGPYMYRLDKEYREALQPLRELTGAFYREVLSLATPEQRAAAIEDARQAFVQYGQTAGGDDLAWLSGLLKPLQDEQR